MNDNVVRLPQHGITREKAVDQDMAAIMALLADASPPEIRQVRQVVQAMLQPATSSG